MATHDLSGKKVAILATDGFERSELHEPKKALEEAGAKVRVIAPHEGAIRAMEHHDWADDIAVDATTGETIVDDFDALVLPGGVMNPDKLRMDPDAVRLVREAHAMGKPIAAICHGPWTLIEADIVDGRRVTSYPSLRTDLMNAGAKWVDEQVVVDRGLVTSRRPDDLAAFCAKVIEEIAEGMHGRAKEAPREQPRA
ncbi:type 1 glutamine amidotransferase domain-containing protein [Sandaracinus amylolyticus]|uniref:type 1 glutamine amidotransferase domain-containing protein n=1 Tax=Sandaracinus amylolyticus TaxID=927083 RepID=UPI001F460DEC|nr:type 1 glutamine amidotransferase domain-containing protein [Sandaracinus amylolyticus]UJR82130.1 Glutamine amidotransferase [Sandaracinus amylolyticus]